MHTLLNISEASTIALHAAGLLAKSGDRPLSNDGIARTLGVSPAHLSKVLQRMTRAGLVKPIRGPGGGFTLSGDPDRIKARAVVEAIEGSVSSSECLLKTGGCGKRSCVFTKMLRSINKQVHEMMETSLSQL